MFDKIKKKNVSFHPKPKPNLFLKNVSKIGNLKTKNIFAACFGIVWFNIFVICDDFFKMTFSSDLTQFKIAKSTLSEMCYL